jgi:hypothetical protein
MHTALKIFAILALASATASATPDAKPAPTPTQAKPATPAAGDKLSPNGAACKPSGAIVFEIDHLVDPEAKMATSLIKVYANGGWTQERNDSEGKALPQVAGCYTKADVQKLTTTLAGAEWKVTTNQMHCMAASPAYTIYRVNGKSVFIRKLCSGDVLDEKSMTKLQAAIAQVEGTVPAQN